ncbi:MAG: hypothetical protein QXS66_02935 [Thermoproteota archaeon]|nr:hypothetical protein [Candidatus Brockarchaeota archaeon]
MLKSSFSSGNEKGENAALEKKKEKITETALQIREKRRYHIIPVETKGCG